MAIYRRVLTGQVAAGEHGEFLAAVEAALEYQAQRGIDARFSVWDSITGPANQVEIISEFDTLSELEQFEELVAQDQTFAELRARVRESMVFETTEITLYRSLV
ncbi:MAG: hypothetical protein V3V06_05135 [Dehalococcoidia bacterium]